MEKKTQLDPKLVEAAFEKVDRLIDFEKRLSVMINNLGIDSLLGVPDYVLAAVAKRQMELTATIIKSIRLHS